MSTSTPSSSTGPTLKALHRALEEVSCSIASFGKIHLAWCMYHQACLPIVGNAWQDYQIDLATHIGSIPGMRALRSAVQKELQWVEKHSAEVGEDTIFASSNAYYLSTSWQHILYSALHQSPILELDAFMPTASTKKAKSAKVDIVCQGGRRWIRHSTIKPLSLLSEFRNAESYVVEEDSTSDEEQDEGQGSIRADRQTDKEPRLSLDLINLQLSKGQVDGIASQCSLMKLARELQAAADVAQSRSQWGRPEVEIVLTRISLNDMSSSLQGKFYNEEEQSRFEARLRAMVAEMEKMKLIVVLKGKRELFEEEEQKKYLPSSITSGETQDASRITHLPELPLPPNAKRTTPTFTLNMDLSALVAMVSQISHLPLSHLPSIEDADKCFLTHHWKTGVPLSDQSDTDEEQGGVRSQGTQHSRALKDQLRRELTTDSFFDAILKPVQDGQQLQLVCTKEAEEKFCEILALVGGPTEQRRARYLFQEDGQEDFWRGSKWEGNKAAREKLLLPVRSVSFSSAEVHPFIEDDDDGNHFQRLARKSVQDGLRELKEPTQHHNGPSTITSSSTGTGIQRQTPHTLASILYGFTHNCSTLTTNIASIKWLARDISRYETAEASARGYVERQRTALFSSAVLFYPRSLAEKMMTSTHLVSSDSCNINDTSVEWGGTTATDDYQSRSKNLYIDAVKPAGAESYEGKTPTVESTHFTTVQPFLGSPASQQGKVKRYLRATRSWLRGPRPRSVLLIRHFWWWPMKPVEDGWMRWTFPLAWKDASRTQTRLHSRDVEGQELSSDSSIDQHEEFQQSDPWWEGVKRDWNLNKLHWIALALTFIAWAFAFTFLVKDLWYEATVVGPDGSTTSPSFYGCTTTFWLGNAECGLDGQSCAPFSYPASVPFRCPASCETTTLGGTRAVGDQLPSYVTLVVGGGQQGNSSSIEPQEATGPFIYRGDSFVCSAAIHAGVLPRNKGGCSSLWLNGAYSGYQGVERNGIQSTSFNSSFPVSYYFDTDVRGEKCTDRSYRGYILNVILLAWVGFILQPKGIVYFFTLVTVGFWHINFISEPREYPMSVGDPMGDFLPTLFIAYAYWRLTFRFVWPAFESLPLERNVWIQGFYWIGVLLDVVFVNVPLSRLVASDIASQPGALVSLIVIIIVVVILGINQVRVLRKIGELPKYLTLSIVGGIIIGLLSAIPTTGLRLHHYIIAMVLLLYCAFATRLSLIYSSFLLGMFLNGAGRWGFDGIIQDVATIVGSGLTGSSLPSFLAASNWTGVPGYGGLSNSTSLISWQSISPDLTSTWDSFQLLVDDVLRLQSSQTSFNLSLLSDYYVDSNSLQSSMSDSLFSSLIPTSNLTLYPGGNTSAEVQALIASQPHYLRLAYYDSTSGSSGDFTEAATVWFNGTFISPKSGAT